MISIKETMTFIETASLEECARIIEEIRRCHDNLLCWDEETYRLVPIGSLSINGDFIQLNAGKETKND